MIRAVGVNSAFVSLPGVKCYSSLSLFVFGTVFGGCFTLVNSWATVSVDQYCVCYLWKPENLQLGVWDVEHFGQFWCFAVHLTVYTTEGFLAGYFGLTQGCEVRIYVGKRVRPPRRGLVDQSETL